MKKAFGIGLVLAGALSAAHAGAPEGQLLDAVRGDDHAAIEKLLAAHADPNAPLPDKSTVLAWAVDRQDGESVRLLLAAGARPNIADAYGSTPLTLACELGGAEIVTDLVKAGADAKTARPDGITALALCAGTSTPETLEALVGKGADVNAADPNGQTALMRAAAFGKTANITFLLQHGAKVNATTAKGFTPLFFALRNKSPDAPRLLLDAGADIKAVLLEDGTSVVAAALIENNAPFALTAVARGADLNQRDRDGRQLIHVAAASGNAELVKLALSKGADANALSQPATAPPPAQPTPAAGGGGKLARADGSPFAARPKGVATPPLVFAAKAGSADAMKALVDAGAKPSAKAEDGTTVALAAAGSGNLAALKYALQIDPNLDAIGPGGRSIVHYAIAIRDPEQAIPILQFLVDKGAKLDVKDAKGDTPGDFINRGGQQDIRLFFMQVLKDRGIASTNH